MTTPFTLQQLGWRPFHQQQLNIDEIQELTPARIKSQHRSQILVQTIEHEITLNIHLIHEPVTVGIGFY